jgi:hypothetical protein
MRVLSCEIWDPKKQDAYIIRAVIQQYLTQLTKMCNSPNIFFSLKVIRNIQRKLRSRLHE